MLLESYYLQNMPILLFFVSGIFMNKFIEGPFDVFFCLLISKTESFCVSDKHMFWTFWNIFENSTIIFNFIEKMLLLSFVSHYFLFIFSWTWIVVTLNPEFNISITFCHFAVCIFIAVKNFRIFEEAISLVSSNSSNNVQYGEKYESFYIFKNFRKLITIE